VEKKGIGERDRMIMKAMPNLNYTTTNMIPIQFTQNAVSFAGLVLIIAGVIGLVLCWLLWLKDKK
jgi:hypothetical protein